MTHNMSPTELIEYAKDYHKKAIALLENKNHDYTKEATDALSNFQASVNNHSVDQLWQAVAVFHTTKFERIMTLVKRGVEPKNETLEDTFLDMDNYGMFLKLAVDRYLKELHRSQNEYDRATMGIPNPDNQQVDSEKGTRCDICKTSIPDAVHIIMKDSKIEHKMCIPCANDYRDNLPAEEIVNFAIKDTSKDSDVMALCNVCNEYVTHVSPAITSYGNTIKMCAKCTPNSAIGDINMVREHRLYPTNCTVADDSEYVVCGVCKKEVTHLHKVTMHGYNERQMCLDCADLCKELMRDEPADVGRND